MFNSRKKSDENMPDTEINKFLLKKFHSKDDFLDQFEKKFDKKKLNDLHFHIFENIETLLLENHLYQFKKLHKLINYVVDETKAIVESCKLAVLACKNDRINILDYVLDSLSEIYFGVTILPDQEVTGHNCFYYAIRSGNTDLIDNLIIKWPENYFNKFPEKLDYFLSSSYDKLRINNIPISVKMKVYIESKLLDIRFLTDISSTPETKFSNNTVVVADRTKFLLESIDILTSSDKVDSKFLFVARFVLHNIHILKRQLKSTYNKLPWEEIEFCLIAFISIHTKQQEINLFYHSIIDFNKIKMYLNTFARCLNIEANIFLKNISTKLGVLPSIPRNIAIKNVTECYPDFLQLYQDYHDIRDFHSLEKMHNCIDLAHSVNPKEQDSRFVIVRMVQILGEYFKNTLESPKLSQSTGCLLLLNLPENTRNIVTKLRNAISHSYALHKRIELEENASTSFFLMIQQDLKKIDLVIEKILFKKKVKAIKFLITEICNSDNLETIKCLLKVTKNINLECYELGLHRYNYDSEIKELEEAITEISAVVTDKSSAEQIMLDSVKKYFEAQKLESPKPLNIIVAISLLKNFFDEANKLYNLRMDKEMTKSIQFRAQSILKNLPTDVLPHNFEKICQICVRFILLIEAKLKYNSDAKTLMELIAKILTIVNPQMTNIKGLNELSKILCGNYINKVKNDSEGGKINHLNKLKTKLSDLNQLLEKHGLKNPGEMEIDFFNKNRKIQATLELIILDILCILSENKNDCLENNWFFLDDFCPSLLGKALRNDLAHANDALMLEPSVALILNAIKLLETNIEDSNIKIGKPNKKHSYLILTYNFNQGLEAIKIKEKMFTAIEEGNVFELEDIIANGGDLLARNANLQTSLHLAAKAPNSAVAFFIYNQKINMPVKDINKQSPLHVACQLGRIDTVEFLIEKMGFSVKDKCDLWNTPLHFAAKNGHVNVVNLLLNSKANPNALNKKCYTPLHYAALYNHVEIVKILFKKTPDKDKTLYGGFTLLHLAAENGYEELTNFLLDNNLKIDQRTDQQATPLHLSSFRGHFEITKILIKRGATVNVKQHTGLTPLHFATERGHTKIVEILISHKANVNDGDITYQNTPLHYAAQDGFNEICEILLKSGANVNCLTVEYFTPLHFAARSGNLETAILLLHYGANVTCKTIHSYAPLHFVAENGFNCFFEFLLRKSCTELKMKNFNGCTPLHLAIENGHIDVVDSICKYDKICIKEKNNAGESSLHIAAKHGYTNVLELLIKNNASVNAITSNKTTPLHLAACNGHSETVEALLKFGANVNALSIDKITPLTLAVLENNVDVAKVLIKNKAHINATDLYIAVQDGRKELVELFIKSGVSVNTTLADSKYTPLYLAVKNNFISIALFLVKNGANVCNECVAVAVYNGHKDMLNILLQNGGDIKKSVFGNTSHLHISAMKGHKDIVIALLKNNANVNGANETRSTPLHLAVQAGHKEIVDILIDNGANVNAVDIDGSLPIHYVAGTNGNFEIAKTLLNNGADFLAKDKKIRTAVELAAAHNHLDIVKLLLKKSKKQDINVKNTEFTLLHIAIMSGRYKIAKYLVKEGADIHITNHLGSKAIHLASREGHKNIVELLINNGAKVDDIGAYEQTPLHYAATVSGCKDLMCFLINYGADINKKDVNGRTPLHIAVQSKNVDGIKSLTNNGAIFDIEDNIKLKPANYANNKEVLVWFVATEDLFRSVKSNKVTQVKECIENGAFVNATNFYDSVCPLHYASWKGFTEIACILLNHKANPNAVCKKGFTSLHYAAKFHHFSLVRMLITNGAIYNVSSKSGKTPRDLSTDKQIINLFQLLDKAFDYVANGNVKIIKDLEKIQNSDQLNMVISQAFNDKKQNLLMTAVTKRFSKIAKLKELVKDDTEEFIRRADVLYREGRYSEALNIREDILKKIESIFGSDSNEVLKNQSAIALIYHRQGKSEESLNMFKKVLEKQNKLFGGNHLDCLNTRLHMALVLNVLRRYEEALVLNKEVYEEGFKQCGNCPLVLSAQNNIAMVLMGMGKYKAALRTYREVFEKKKSYYGSSHSETLRTLSCITQLVLEDKNDTKSVKSLEELLAMQKKHLGINNPDTVHTQVNLANVYFKEGHLLKALSNFKENFEQRKAILGENHPCIKDIIIKEKIIRKTKELVGDSLPSNFDRASDDLRSAANEGDLETVKFILRNQVHLNEADKDGRTALHFAVNNGHQEIIRLLINAGADIGHSTNKGNTPLHTACSKGNKEVIDFLLTNLNRDNLCDFVNAQTVSGGTTALHVLAKNGCDDIAKKILSCGAAYNIPNSEGKTPLDLVPRENKQFQYLFQLIDKVFQLVSKGDPKVINFLNTLKSEDFAAVTKCCNKERNTLMMIAISNKHSHIARELVQMLVVPFKEKVECSNVEDLAKQLNIYL